MICGQCREREAVVFIRRSGGGSSGDSALCDACARSRGIAAGKGVLELSLDDLIAGGPDAPSRPTRSHSCPACGMELSKLKREGRLGCPSCADAFRQDILRAIVPAPGAPEELAEGADAAALASEARGSAGPAAGAAQPELERRLSEALAAEDYEAAAAIRDKLAGPSAPAPAPAADPSFPLDPAALIDGSGPESDVVLWTAARACRDLEGVPFPGSPRPAPAAGRSLLGGMKAAEGWLVRTMSELGPCGRRSLAERGLVPRDFAAVDEAVIGTLPGLSAYALLDSVDHLRAIALRPGLDAGGALSAAERVAAIVGRGAKFASRPGIGWICASLDDCGRGCALSAALHLPALAATGLTDRLFKALMAEGAAIRGLYSSAEGSAGSLYEILIDSRARVGDPASALEAAARTAAQAERRARSELAERSRAALEDAEGRAFGIARFCRLMGAEEAASNVSALRLAALRGSLKGASPSALAALLVSLGPGSLGRAAGMRSPPAAEEQDGLRAAVVKAALADAEYRTEEAS